MPEKIIPVSILELQNISIGSNVSRTMDALVKIERKKTSSKLTQHSICQVKIDELEKINLNVNKEVFDIFNVWN